HIGAFTKHRAPEAWPSHRTSLPVSPWQTLKRIHRAVGASTQPDSVERSSQLMKSTTQSLATDHLEIRACLDALQGRPAMKKLRPGEKRRQAERLIYLMARLAGALESRGADEELKLRDAAFETIVSPGADLDELRRNAFERLSEKFVLGPEWEM